MAARILLLVSCLLAPRQPIFVCEMWAEEARTMKRPVGITIPSAIAVAGILLGI